MEQHNNQIPIGERVAVLESQIERFNKLDAKLDELLKLKDQGAGAFWLMSLVVGSGLIGLVWAAIQFFSKPHL